MPARSNDAGVSVVLFRYEAIGEMACSAVVSRREALRLFVQGEAGGLYLLSGLNLVLQNVFGDGVVGDFDPRCLGELGNERLLPRLIWAITRPQRDARGRRHATGGFGSRSRSGTTKAESGAEHGYGGGCCAPDKPGSLAGKSHTASFIFGSRCSLGCLDLLFGVAGCAACPATWNGDRPNVSG